MAFITRFSFVSAVVGEAAASAYGSPRWPPCGRGSRAGQSLRALLADASVHEVQERQHLVFHSLPKQPRATFHLGRLDTQSAVIRITCFFNLRSRELLKVGKKHCMITCLFDLRSLPIRVLRRLVLPHGPGDRERPAVAERVRPPRATDARFAQGPDMQMQSSRSLASRRAGGGAR